MSKPQRSFKKFKKKGVLKSGLEIRINKELKKRKVKFDYEKYSLPYVVQKNYWPDFIVYRNEGPSIILEVKGYFPQEDQRKMRSVKEASPDLDIRMVFDKDNKIPRTKMRYSDWCIKYNFPYCVGSIPEDWFK